MFTDSDLFVQHLGQITQDVDDSIAFRYVGFVAVSSVTIFEVAVKKLLIDFAEKRDPMLGRFALITFEKLNAHIQRDNIERHLKYFGDDYSENFKRIVDKKEQERIGEGSLKGSYKNLLTWRHQFVHAGTLPNQATLQEAIKAYHLGKEVVIALSDVLAPLS